MRDQIMLGQLYTILENEHLTLLLIADMVVLLVMGSKFFHITEYFKFW